MADEAKRLIESVFGAVNIEGLGIKDVVAEETRQRRQKQWAHRVGFVPGVSDDTDYDPDATYMRSTNSHDHSTSVRINFPKDLNAMLGKVVADEGTPYESLGDLVRDATVHRAMYWHRKIEAGAVGVSIQAHAARMEAKRLEREALEALVHAIGVELEVAADGGDVDDVAELVDVLRGYVDGGVGSGTVRKKMLEMVVRYE